MFAISHEVPMCLLEESRKFNDYDYALVHLFEKSLDYYNFYQKSVEEGRRVILDNSAYELGEPFDLIKYRAYIEELRPTEYILPDYRDNASKNLQAIKDWVLIDDFIKIGVVHGETYEAFCQNYLDIQPYVDKIAISAESFFFTSSENPETARIKVIEEMVKDGIINEDFPHHILGALSPTEYKSFLHYNWIESADTSNPVLHGLLGLQYEGENGLEKKSSVKLDSLMFANFTTETIQTVYYNIKWFRSNLSRFTPRRFLSFPKMEEATISEMLIQKGVDNIEKVVKVIQLIPEEFGEISIKEIQSGETDTCPERYASRKVHGMDVIDLVKFWGLNFNEGSILKYLLRDKGEDISDMGKIVIFAQRELESLKEEELNNQK